MCKVAGSQMLFASSCGKSTCWAKGADNPVNDWLLEFWGVNGGLSSRRILVPPAPQYQHLLNMTVSREMCGPIRFGFSLVVYLGSNSR